MIPHKVQRVRHNVFGCHETFRSFAVVWELEQMKHVRVLLFQDDVPGVVSECLQCATDGLVPKLPTFSSEDWVGTRNRTKLKLRRVRKLDMKR